MLYDSNQYDPTESGYGPIPEGDYDFTVRNANATVSKNGNNMIELKLEVKIGSEQPITAYDWLVAVTPSLWKIYSFCEAIGRDFQASELLPEHCLSQQGRTHFILGSPNQKGRPELPTNLTKVSFWKHLKRLATPVQTMGFPFNKADQSYGT